MSLILFAAPAADIAQKAERIIRRRQLDIPVITADDKNVRAAVLAYPDPFVVISRGGVAEEIKQIPGRTVVEVTTSFNDILAAVASLDTAGMRRVAVVMRGNILFETPQNFSLAGMDILVRPCDTYEEIAATVKSLAQMKKVDGIAGCRYAVRVAEETGIPNAYVDTSEKSIEKAIDDALKILDAKRKESLQLERLEAVIGNIDEGIVVLDEQERPAFFNEEANVLFGGNLLADFVAVMGAALKDYAGEQLVTIHGRKALFRMVPVGMRNRRENTVLIFHAAEAISKQEQKVRASLYQKGFYAKIHFPDIRTTSPRMKEIIVRAVKFARTNANVLILGETGTGKEGMAQSIHNASPRAKKPFVSVNCASIPPSLIESELFGYVEGAFTGARRAGKKGLFELADGGTIFLDEIAELPLDIQGRLLRVLQEREIMRVGDDRIVALDIRMICATNKDLRALVAENKFREDLYYRVNVLRVQLPPLRERCEDILPLLRHYFERYAPQKDFDQFIQQNVRERLLAYDWPGNIRELRNIAEVFACLGDAAPDTAQLDELLDARRMGSQRDRLEIPLGLSLKEVELALIERMLETYTPDETCAKLGISRVTLWRRLRREV